VSFTPLWMVQWCYWHCFAINYVEGLREFEAIF
jgi:hypothetical protein